MPTHDGRGKSATRRPSAWQWLALVVLALPVAPQVTAAQVGYVRVGNGQLTEALPLTGFSVPVGVDLSRSPDTLASLTFTVRWDPASFTYDSYTAGPFGQVVVNDAQSTGGTLHVSVFSAVGTTQSFNALTVHFLAGEVGGGIQADVLTAGNEAGLDITHLLVPVDMALCVGLLGARGDANGDGQVNIIDAQQVARYAVGLPVLDLVLATRLGDLDTDGQASIIDAQQVARHSVFLPVAFPVGEDVAGCREQLYCVGGGGNVEVVVEDTISVTNSGAPTTFTLLSDSGDPISASMRSTVPWVTPSVPSGVTPFVGDFTFFGDPELPDFQRIDLEFVPISSEATTVVGCMYAMTVLHPVLSADQDSLHYTTTSGASIGQDSIWVFSGGTSGGLGGVPAGVAVSYVSGGTGWLTVSGPPWFNFTSFDAGTVFLDATTAPLPVGVHVAQVTIYSPRYTGIEPVTIPVVVEVLDPPA